MPDQPLDHVIQQLLAEGRLSRRRFIGRVGAAGFAVSSASALLSACGGTQGTQQGAPTNVDVTHEKVPLDELNFTNWPLYIDKATIPDFEREFDATVNYTEEINDNNEFFGKVREPLQRDQPIDRDIVVLTDPMAARWVRSGYTEPIDKGNVPNVTENLAVNLRSPAFDPERNFTVPWQSGMDGIGYNRKETGREITSLNDLFDPAFKGRVSMLNDFHDSASLVLQLNGIDTEDATLEDVLAAIQRIEEESAKGQIRRFTGNDYTTDLTNGNLAMAVAYSGDMIQLKADNPDLDFVIPEEGGVLWTDNMMIPQGAENPYAAEVMMNYVYNPEIAAQIAAYVNYVTPVTAAKDLLAEDDPDIANDPLIFPDQATLANLHPYPNLTPEEEREAEEAFAVVAGA